LNQSLIFMWIASGIGIALLAGFVFTGMQRSYLLYLGFAFLVTGLLVIKALAPLRWLIGLIALAAFVFAFIEGITDTKVRIQKFREEQLERETAFAEYLQAVTEQETDREKTKKYEL